MGQQTFGFPSINTAAGLSVLYGAANLVGDLTVYVTTGGNDSDAARPRQQLSGDLSAYPFATIQAALDYLPKGLAPFRARVVVGGGTFAGAWVQGFASAAYGLQIVGTLGLATLTSGPNGFTAGTGTNSTTLKRNGGAGWTPGNLEGMLVVVTAGGGYSGDPILQSIGVIRSNDADTAILNDYGIYGLDNTSVVQIVLPTTIINAASGADYLGTTVGLGVTNCAADVYVRRLWVDVGTGTAPYGFYAANNTGTVSLGNARISDGEHLVGTGAYLYAQNLSISDGAHLVVNGTTTVGVYSVVSRDARLEVKGFESAVIDDIDTADCTGNSLTVAYGTQAEVGLNANDNDVTPLIMKDIHFMKIASSGLSGTNAAATYGMEISESGQYAIQGADLHGDDDVLLEGDVTLSYATLATNGVSWKRSTFLHWGSGRHVLYDRLTVGPLGGGDELATYDIVVGGSIKLYGKHLLLGVAFLEAAAAGANSAAATVCAEGDTVVTSGTGGVRLRASGVGGADGAVRHFVVNDSGSTINLYPPTGGTINGGGTDAPVSMTNGSVAICHSRDNIAFHVRLISSGGSGDALTSNPLSQFAATTSLQLAGVISDETGSGSLVFATSPTLVTAVAGGATTGVGITATGGSTSGNAIEGTGGPASIGVRGVGGSTSGTGVKGEGTGTGNGVEGVGGSSNAYGVQGTGGGTSGTGVRGVGASGGKGGLFQGSGSAAGLQSIGGSSGGTGGVFSVGGGNGYGVDTTGGGSGSGITATGGSSNGTGVDANGGGTNGKGIVATGNGTGSAIRGSQTASGYVLELLADTTSPVKAPIHVDPQDAVPTGAHVLGDLMVMATTGSWLSCSTAGTPGTWTSIAAQILGPDALFNVGLDDSASAGALTIALKQADGSTNPSTGQGQVIVAMRQAATTGGYVLRRVSSSLSLSLASGVTMNMLASQDNYLWVYLIDSDGSGTLKLAVSTVPMDEGTLQSAVSASATVTVTSASPAVVTETGHNRANNDIVTFTNSGGALPTGISADTRYWVTNVATNTYRLATSPGGTATGGSAVNTSSTGTGTHSVRTAAAFGKLVSDGYYTARAIRFIGRLKYNLATSGTWLDAAEVSMAGSVLHYDSIHAIYKSTDTTNHTNGSQTTPIMTTRTLDTHNFYNASGGWFQAFQPGRYEISVQFAFNSASWSANSYVAAGAWKNASIAGTQDFTLGEYVSIGAATQYSNFAATRIIDLAAGDYVNLGIINGSGATLNFDGYDIDNWVTVRKVA